MDTKAIKDLVKELMAHMGRTSTRRLVVEQNGLKIEIEQQPNRHTHEVVEHVSDNPMKTDMEIHRVHVSSARGVLPSQQEEKKGAPQEPVSGTYVTSPMVGTFYRSPSPEAPAFVKEGDVVNKGDVVCIIEAMKVMNEVKAEVSGKVQKVLVDNGHPVEFGTKLYLIS